LQRSAAFIQRAAYLRPERRKKAAYRFEETISPLLKMQYPRLVKRGFSSTIRNPGSPYSALKKKE
jgi:hypothetical protein